MSAGASEPARKIVFVNRYFYPDQSATSQMLSDLAFGLARRGFSVHVVCSRQRYDHAQANLPSSQHIAGVRVHRVWTTRFGRDWLPGRAMDYASFYVSSGVRLLSLVARADTLVAETDPPLISLVAAAVTAVRRARLVNWLHDVFPEVATLLGANPLPPWIGRLLVRLRDASLQAAGSNVVLGTRMRELLRRQVPRSKLCIIENWAASEAGERANARNELRIRLGLADKFVVGYSGNLGRAHEFQTLLDAASRCGGDPDIVFLMIGAGAGMNALRQAVADRDLGNFRFLPFQPRESLADTMAAADVHWLSLLPALEGLIVPSKLYGILAAGRPVLFIGDPDGEVARVIGPARAGLTVSIGEGTELARHIVRLKTDRMLRETMGANAYRLYGERYTEQRALDLWTELLGAAGEGTERLTPESPVADAGIRPPSGR